MYLSRLGYVLGHGLALVVFSAPLSAHDTVLPDPVDAYEPVTRTHYHPIMNQYRATSIINRPGNWRELNDRAERIGGPLGQLRRVDEPIRKRKRK